MNNENIGKSPSERCAKKLQNVELKKLLCNFSVKNYNSFEEAFDRMDDRQKCDIYIKVLKFVLPTISAVKFEDAESAASASDLLRAVASYPDNKI